MTKYIHDEQTHQLKDPNIIVPVVMKLLQPKSVVDVGCGIGTFLHVFKREGVQDILGLDGPWVDQKLLAKYIKPEEFIECDLGKDFSLDKAYDLVVSLEVAEHLAPSAAEAFVKNLVKAGNVILFSAAIPLQRGQNHLNEQWLSWWETKFSKHNYILQDVIRPLFWDNPEIFIWYKQNMVLFTPKDYPLPLGLKCSPMTDVVHFELFTARAKECHNMFQGRVEMLFIVKILFRKIKRIILQILSR